MRLRLIQLGWFAALTGLSMPVFAGVAATRWQTAHVLSAELNGHGPNPNAKSHNSQRRDIWWTYCLSTGTLTYTAVLRESPAKSGMSIDSTVRVSIQKDGIHVFNPQGKRYVLKVIRQGDRTICR